MKIVDASPKDIDTVLNLINQARNAMCAIGNTTQWPEGYPSSDIVIRDINNGFCHICIEEETPVASFVFMPGPDETYSQIINGQWVDDNQEYYVIHRLASNGKFHGVFRKIMEYCKSISSNIRIDTHRSNSIMLHCLRNNGFDYCGIIHVADGSERMAFQYTEKNLRG